VSLRLRLTLWYAGLTSLTVIAISLLAYVAHARTQYLDVDRALVEEASYLAPVLELTSTGDPFVPDVTAPDGFQTFVRLYNEAGEPISESPLGAARPPLTATETLAADDSPAFDRVLQWLPGGTVSASGGFATSRSGDHRVRLYVQPVSSDEGIRGYVQTWTSLAGIDRSIIRFRLLIFGGAMLSTVVVWTGGLAISGWALRPLAALLQTADSISRSGRFDQRVEEPERSDELGRLARLFNQMLDALEESYRAQQRFVADAAHELRAPLTVIRGNIELLARVQAMSEADRQEALAHLEQEALRLSRLVDELLILAQSDAGLVLELRPVELDAVLLQAVGQMRRGAAASAIVVAEIEPVAIEGNSDRLHQLITILLDNALKYSPADAGPVSVSLTRRDDIAELVVQDQGVGIPEDSIPHVFERFYRVDVARSRDPGGAGLGLSIARWIAEQHRATIELTSEAGSGTTVRVRFRARDEASPASRGGSFVRGHEGELADGRQRPSVASNAARRD